MSLAINRKMILAAIICLLLYQVGTWITFVAGAVWGAGAAVIVAVVSYPHLVIHGPSFTSQSLGFVQQPNGYCGYPD